MFAKDGNESLRNFFSLDASTRHSSATVRAQMVYSLVRATNVPQAGTNSAKADV